MNVESWCTVELNSKEDWLRANRKHNPNAFASSVFTEGDSNQHHSSRLDFNSCKPEKHRERRHFPDKDKTQLKWRQQQMANHCPNISWPVRGDGSVLNMNFVVSIYKEFLFHQTHGLTRYQNYFRNILFSVGATTNKTINSKMYAPTLRLSFFIDLQFVHFYADFVL